MMNVLVGKSKGKNLFLKQHIMGYLFLAPTIVLFAIFTIVPLVMAFGIAFTEFNTSEILGFNGFENFVTAFTDMNFLKTFLNISIYAGLSIPIGIASALLAAVLVNSKLKGVKVFRVLFYIPAVTSGVAVAVVWKWMFNVEYGVFNGILSSIHLPTLKWLNSDSYLVMVCVVIVATWSGLGGNMLIFLASLKGISPEYYEAATVDGANGVQRLRYITIPSIAPTLYFVITMSIIGAFQLFDLVFIMVPDAAMTWARTPVVMIYEKGFTRFNGGLGTAMSLILFAVIMVFTFVFQSIMKEDKTV